MKAYSPFNKAIRDTEIGDLSALKQAAEGWYIEYKREVPNASSIAKSLSAFANTYGGWLFIGVEEESKENPVAGAFPGISRAEVDAALQRMRKSAADLINPTPYFETKVMWGPAQELRLLEDRCIICAWVPQSINAPHVHKSGVIYRRVSDASEPRAESDRFVLDQLWRRAEDAKRRHKEWHDRDPEFSEQEKLRPYVRVMLVSDRWGDRDVWIEAEDDEIRPLLGASGGVSSIPFDTIYTSAEGLIGRQLVGNDPHNLVLTWRLRHNLQSDVIIPLPLYQCDNLTALTTELLGYHHAEQFVRVLSKYPVSKLRVVDLNFMFNILIGVAEIQERLCKLAGWSDSYYVKVKVLNAWRTVPFIDATPVLDGFEKNGPPMCLDTVASSPRGTDPENYVEVPRYTDISIEAARSLIQAFVMFSPLALAFGVPPWISHDEESEVTPYHEALQEAGRRAIDVQRRRNERLKRGP